MMFKVYEINMLNFAVYVGKSDSLEYALMACRLKMRALAISGWQIIRESDGIILAQSKEQS